MTRRPAPSGAHGGTRRSQLREAGGQEAAHAAGRPADRLACHVGALDGPEPRGGADSACRPWPHALLLRVPAWVTLQTSYIVSARETDMGEAARCEGPTDNSVPCPPRAWHREAADKSSPVSVPSAFGVPVMLGSGSLALRFTCLRGEPTVTVGGAQCPGRGRDGARGGGWQCPRDGPGNGI